ncbi:MAG: transglutaminase-like domain-containing protein [Candidatus Woesearchaeota archaeon]
MKKLAFFIMILLFLKISYSFIIYNLPEESLVNLTLTFEVEAENAKGKVAITTNKYPKSLFYQDVFSEFRSSYEFELDKKITKSYSSLLKLKTQFQKLNEKIPYSRSFHYVNSENFCYEGICDKISNILLYLVKDLVEEDLFKTICKINHFVNSFITYDLEFSSDQNPTIRSILSHKRGVCIHYATLMSEILNSLGIENEIVFGYAKSSVNSTNWEAHAWLKVKIGNEYFFFDPTFDMCALNNVLQIYFDNKPLYSSITYYGVKKDIYFADYVDIQEIKSTGKFVPNISINFKLDPEEISYDDKTNLILNVKNYENFYVYVLIKLISTENVNLSEDELFLVLSPNEERTIILELTHEYKDSKYEYTVPVSLFSSWSHEETKFFKIKNIKNNKQIVENKNKVFSSLENKKLFDIVCHDEEFYRASENVNQRFLKDFNCYVKNNGNPFSTKLIIRNGEETYEEFLLLSSNEIYYINLSKYVKIGKNILTLQLENQSKSVTINVIPLNYSVEYYSKEIIFYDFQKEKKSVEVYANNVLILQTGLDENNYSSSIIVKKSDISRRLMLQKNEKINLKILVKFKSYEYSIAHEIIIEVNTFEKLKYLFEGIINAVKSLFN